MYIWIDESYDPAYPGNIVVAALIFHSGSKEEIEQCHANVMKRIRTYNKNNKKTIKCSELHETVLFKDSVSKQVKYWAFTELFSKTDIIRMCAVYKMIPNGMVGNLTEEYYFSLVSELIDKVCVLSNDTIYIIMDDVFAVKQRNRLLQKFKNVYPDKLYQFSFANSAAEKGLQFADLIAGTVRRHLKNEKNDARAYEQLENQFFLELSEKK